MLDYRGMGDSTGQGDGERVQNYQAWFWLVEGPLEAKFAVEKAIRMLLAREPGDGGTLVFHGSSQSRDPVYRSRFCLEAVEPGRHRYSLQMEAAASGKWFTQEKLEQTAGRTWQAWIRPLQSTPPPQPLTSDRALYAQVVRETLEREASLASQKEDEAPIEAVRQAVLAGFRQGKRCSESDKEGITTFRFDGREFIRTHVGEWEDRVVFAGADALLADLRKFYHWKTCRDTYPHSPPEVEVWKYILSRMK
jgi:hypothetical protein